MDICCISDRCASIGALGLGDRFTDRNAVVTTARRVSTEATAPSLIARLVRAVDVSPPNRNSRVSAGSSPLGHVKRDTQVDTQTLGAHRSDVRNLRLVAVACCCAIIAPDFSAAPAAIVTLPSRTCERICRCSGTSVVVAASKRTSVGHRRWDGVLARESVEGRDTVVCGGHCGVIAAISAGAACGERGEDDRERALPSWTPAHGGGYTDVCVGIYLRWERKWGVVLKTDGDKAAAAGLSLADWDSLGGTGQRGHRTGTLVLDSFCAWRSSSVDRTVDGSGFSYC